MRQDTTSLAAITTDTGAFAPGYQQFVRFKTPGECLGAVEIAKEMLRRSTATQIAEILNDTAASSDTIPVGAADVARSCAARFNVSNVAAEVLPDLFTLTLDAGQDNLAEAIVTRRLALAPNLAARASVSLQALAGYLKAEPVRLGAARKIVAQVDAWGTAAQSDRMDAHAAMLQFAMARFDEPQMREEANRIIALGHEGNISAIEDRGGSFLMTAYQALGQIAYVEGSDSLVDVMSRAKNDLGRFSTPTFVRFRTLSVDDVRDALLPFNAQRYKTAGLPPMAARFWYPAPPRAWPPTDGHAALVIYGGDVSNDCARSDWLIFWGFDMRHQSCGALYTYLQQWNKEYGERLNVTLIAQSVGNAARSNILSPAAEADSLKWFFIDHAKLKITLGVVEDSVWTVSPIDGRRFRFDTTFYGRSNIFFNAVREWRGNMTSWMIVMLYDDKGTLRFVGTDGLANPILHQMLRRTMRTATPSVSNGGRS